MKNKFNLKDIHEDFKNLKVFKYKKGRLRNVFAFKSKIEMINFLINNQ